LKTPNRLQDGNLEPEEISTDAPLKGLLPLALPPTRLLCVRSVGHLAVSSGQVHSKKWSIVIDA
jgi:hypothetical protein